MVKVRGWLKGAQPDLLWLGPTVLRFEANLVNNCHAQRECKITEIGRQNDR